MLKLFVLLLACQFSVEVQPFTVQVDTLRIPPQEPATLEPVPIATPAPPFMAFFTATYCGPCQGCKRNLIPQLKAAGYRVAEYEMTDPANAAKYSSVIGKVPAFIACDGVTGQWLTEPRFGAIDLTTAKWMLDGSSLTSTKSPATVQLVERVVSESPMAPPVRFIQWPGWGQIDLETYNRNCNCGMCQSIRSQQQEYRRQLQMFQRPQSKVTPDQEGTPHALVETLLDQMQLQTGDVLAELGCGDGRILIAAAKRGIRGIGVELDPVRAQVARENVQRSGLSELITVETGDALEFDLSRATVATTYLYPPLLAKLSPRLKSLRVVGSPYHEVPGLPMTQFGDVWIYRNGGGSNGTVQSSDGRRVDVKEGTGSNRDTDRDRSAGTWIATDG